MKAAEIRQLQHIVSRYIEAGQPWPAPARDVAAWAIQNRLWQPQQASLVSQCADQLAYAMREEYFQDPQGRRVRAKHAARVERNGEQVMLWADARTAPREFIEIAFQHRRQSIVGDCRQLKVDVDSFNQNRSRDNPIPMVYDFTFDLLEIELLHS